LSIRPKHIKALVRRGALHLRRGDLAEAMSDLQTAARLEPSSGASAHIALKIREVKRLLADARARERETWGSIFR
jgi:Flp pilus assembly protein TadD